MPYGEKGIDTSYERRKIHYNPKFSRQMNEYLETMPEEIISSIERSYDFSLYKSQAFYKDLLHRLDLYIKEVSSHIKESVLFSLNIFLESNKNKDLFALEKKHSKYDQSHWVETYVLLMRMKFTIKKHSNILEQDYQSKFGVHPEEGEKASLEFWAKTQFEVDKYYESLYHDHDHAVEDQYNNQEDVSAEIHDIQQRELQRISRLHETIADVGFVHQNRYYMYDDLLTKLYDLVFRPGHIMGSGGKEMLYMTMEMKHKKKAIGQLIESFNRKTKEHMAMKHKMIMHDDEKEAYAAKKNIYYQELYIESEDTRSDLMNLDEKRSDMFDEMAEELSESIISSKNNFNDSTTDMIQIMKVDYNHLQNQAAFIVKKEKTRRYIQILKDLDDKRELTEDWIENYVTDHHYRL